MSVNFVVGVVVHESAAASGPSGLEGWQGGRSLDPPRCAVLFLDGVDELGVGVELRSVGGLKMVWRWGMLRWKAE